MKLFKKRYVTMMDFMYGDEMVYSSEAKLLYKNFNETEERISIDYLNEKYGKISEWKIKRFSNKVEREERKKFRYLLKSNLPISLMMKSMKGDF